MASEYEWLLESSGRDGDAEALFALAGTLEAAGDLHTAATAYDRAFGLQPQSAAIIEARLALLERLSVREYGIRFRYVPAGSFLMGCDDGDPDERPAHAVRLDHYWVSETPVSWSAFCDLMDWEPPPQGHPRNEPSARRAGQRGGFDAALFHLQEENKVRLQYCEDATLRARDWHAHAPEHEWTGPQGTVSSRKLFGEPAREDSRRPWGYDSKPMVGVSWQDAEELCGRLTTAGREYRLPTEAEWEKAARGGLIGCRYPWGDEAPSESRCDFRRFEQFSILPMRRFPPNGYGLYAMSGGVWEWTSDWYDAEAYRRAPEDGAAGEPRQRERVLRGGSWADCAEVLTVSFRMSRGSSSWRSGEWGGHLAPNIGFRMCRTEGR